MTPRALAAFAGRILSRARTALRPAVLALLALSAGACGSAHDVVHPVSSAGGGEPSPILTYGHSAGAADRRAITGLVERYFAAAAAEDGAAACALTYPLFAETIPETYAEPPGPRYLHGATTCAAVLSSAFRHLHASLTGPVAVIGVRVRGDRAYALLAFRGKPASFVKARRERGAWTIDSLLVTRLR